MKPKFRKNKSVITVKAVVYACLMLLFLSPFGVIKGNNVTVSNMSYAADSVMFDITWDNSWRNTSSPGSSNNYDGVWVFLKFRHSCASDSLIQYGFRHMWLKTSSAEHYVPAGTSIEVGTTTIAATPRGMGVFIYRSADGSGTFSASNVKLKWDKTAQGASGTDWEIQVFALEMVYIPAAAFYLGDQSSENYFYKIGSPAAPYLVSNENAITLGTATGNLYANSYTSGMSGSLPADFPKGYGPFWVMKYEVTQQQYVDFLNSLSRSQQNSYTLSSIPAGIVTTASKFVMSNSSTVSYRNGIRCPDVFHASKPITFFCDLNNNGIGNEADDGLTLACNYLGYGTNYLLNYLDWAGLRPMSEMEFEKIGRGSDAVYGGVISGELIWGLTATIASNYTFVTGVSNSGALNENPSNTGVGLIHASNSNPNGPRRIGSTYTNATDRIFAGSSYYGVADIGGNVNEHTVRVAAASGFQRLMHGDGDNYTAYNANWLTNSGYRGSSFGESINYARTSDRRFMNPSNTTFNYFSGGRGVR